MGPTVPFGAGSGDRGGTLPLGRAVWLSLQRLVLTAGRTAGTVAEVRAAGSLEPVSYPSPERGAYPGDLRAFADCGGLFSAFHRQHDRAG